MEKVKAHNISIFFLVLLGLILPGTASLFAAGKWSVSSSVQFSNGSYIFEDKTSTYYLYGGIRYHTPTWGVSANIPLIGQNSDLVTNTGGTILPAGHHENEGSTGSHHDDGMMREGVLSNFDMGLGDIYLRGEYVIFAEEKVLPYVSGTMKLKIPTASTAHNFGTGKFDYGLGFSFRKRTHTYIALIDLGYWRIGDLPEIDYQDTHTVGAGLGNFFAQGRLGLMLYFETYSKIFSEFEANRQITAGLNYRINPQLIFTVIGGGGLSETSPDFLLSGGLELTL